MRFLAVSIAAVGIAAAVAAQTAPASKQETASKTSKKEPAVPYTAARSSAGKSSPAKSSAAKSSVSKSAVSKTGVSKTGTAKSGSKAGAKSKKAVAARRPPLQQQPSVDRYKEIQQALADKGYFKGTADGAWGAESVDALKRFQKDQNLDTDGKIGALSLIALGLGPKRGEAPAPAATSGAGPVDPPPVAQPEP